MRSESAITCPLGPVVAPSHVVFDAWMDGVNFVAWSTMHVFRPLLTPTECQPVAKVGADQSPLVPNSPLSSSATPLLFHSRLKPFFSANPSQRNLFFIFRTDSMDSQTVTDTSEHIRFLIFYTVSPKRQPFISWKTLSKINRFYWFFCMLNPEKIWRENLTRLSISPVRCSYFTLVNPKKSFSTLLFIHTSDYFYVISEGKQAVIHLPTLSKNVTTLTCELQNFFIWLKVCCVFSNVGRSDVGSCLLSSQPPSSTQIHRYHL